MESVDFYCERIAAGFGGEPLNALTGLAFLLVGLWRFREAPESADRHVALALIMLGLMAPLHHLFALRLTLQADIWANVLYLSTFGALLLRRLAGAGRFAILPAAALVVALKEVLSLPQTWAMLGRWGDMFSLMTCFLAVLAVLVSRTAPATGRGLALGAGILALGLPFRFLDQALCASFPLGTHWLWHLVNAASIAIILTTLASHPAPTRD